MKRSLLFLFIFILITVFFSSTSKAACNTGCVAGLYPCAVPAGRVLCANPITTCTGITPKTCQICDAASECTNGIVPSGCILSCVGANEACAVTGGRAACANPRLSCAGGRACETCDTVAVCSGGIGSTSPTPIPNLGMAPPFGINLGGPTWCDSDFGIPTALGCLPTNAKSLTILLVKWSVGVAGLAALGVFVYGGILYISSSGDPKKVKAAQEMFIAAISGIILIVISIIVLNFIGIKILNLGGLGFNA